MIRNRNGGKTRKRKEKWNLAEKKIFSAEKKTKYLFFG